MMKKFFIAVCAALVPTVAIASNATAALDVTGLAPDMTSVETLALAIATGLLSLWGIRKVIKLVNRS